MDYILYLFVGGFSGFLGGLFGIGGGIIIVPALILTFSLYGLPVDVVTHLAIGTSLATIAITSVVSTFTHHQHGSVRWDIFAWIAPGIILGSFVGGFLAAVLVGNLLQLLFGLLMVAVGLQLLTSVRVKLFPTPRKIQIAGAGAIIGSFSTLFGIGGGILTTPFLSSFGTKMHQAVATSAACGLPIAIVGGLTYIYTGHYNPLLPNGSFGYVFLPAWIGIVVAGMPFARIGASLAHRLDERLLKQLFAVILLILGIRFILRNAQFALG